MPAVAVHEIPAGYVTVNDTDDITSLRLMVTATEKEGVVLFLTVGIATPDIAPR